jgi:hypothetical protein
VVQAARELCTLNSQGHFCRESFLRVKQQFPELRLPDSTIRRCYVHGDDILQQAEEDTTLKAGGYRGMAAGPALFRKGLRRRMGQGRPVECGAVLWEVGKWHEEQRRRQIFVDEFELTLEFQERLQEHIQALETVASTGPLSSGLGRELRCMRARLRQLRDLSSRWKVSRRLQIMLGAVRYSVQKVTDLPPEEQHLRMTPYWQHLDWMYHIIKTGNVAVLAAYVADPRAYVRAANDTVLCMFDEVPKWVAVMPNKLLATAAEAAGKRAAAAKRRWNRKGRSGQHVVVHTDEHVQEIVSGPQGFNGAEKFRIATIMLQLVRNYFHQDLEPVGEIGPTVCIFLALRPDWKTSISTESAAVQGSFCIHS